MRGPIRCARKHAKAARAEAMALNHNPESDAIAALPVMLFEAGLGSFRGGLACVDVFFVMIGYTLSKGGEAAHFVRHQRPWNSLA